MTQQERSTLGAVVRALDNITVRGGESVKTLAAVMNTLDELASGKYDDSDKEADDGDIHG